MVPKHSWKLYRERGNQPVEEQMECHRVEETGKLEEGKREKNDH